MLGRNTSGKPEKKHYLLGLGCIYLSELDATTGLAECYRCIGVSQSLSVTAEVETLEHRSPCGGLNEIDDRIEISKTLNISLSMDELSHENAALFFGGSVDTPANPAVAGLVDHVVATSATKGCTYELKDIPGGTYTRAMGLVQGADLVLTHDAGGAALVLTEGTDYSLDLLAGTFCLLEGGAAAIDGTKTINAVLAANAGAPATIEQVKGLTQTSAEYALKFVGVNGRDSSVFEIEFHSVRLSADGEVSLINAEEIAQLSMSGVAQRNASWPTDSKTMTISRAS